MISKSRTKLVYTILLVCLSISILFNFEFTTSAGEFPDDRDSVTVEFNENVINDLHRSLDTENPNNVLDLLFSQIKPVVNIYNTENYYYFRFYVDGRAITGNLELDVSDRDSGILHLTYFEITGHDIPPDDYTTYAYGEKDGVIVKKKSDYVYVASYKGRSVEFRLNNIVPFKPRTLSLSSTEAYVGPIVDESGIKFSLIFDSDGKYFLYVLNEDDPIIDHFVRYSDDIDIGNRTGFAFYNDKNRDRKILVGVNLNSQMQNNYYDGPFDQLPDNFVGKTNIRHFIEMADPSTSGKLDQYGNDLSDAETRYAIAPYRIYANRKELDPIDECENADGQAGKFYKCITDSE